jgi:predicted MFS family arabinose efflux permease
MLFAFGGGAVAAMSATSTIAARFGAGRVAAVAGILMAPVFPWLALAPDGPPVLLAALLLGAVTGTMEVAMNAAASDLERQGGRAIMSSFHAFWSIGGLAAAALSGVLASAGWGVPATLAATSLAVALASVCGLSLPATRDLPVARDRLRLRLQLPPRSLVLLGLLALLCFAAEGSVGDWFGVYLRTVVGTGEAWATTAYTAFALAMVAARLFGDHAVRRLGPVRTVRMGAALALGGMAAALAWPDPWVVDAGMVLVGLGVANVVPTTFSAAARQAGTAGVAVVTSSGYAGLLLVPPLIGNTADLLGLRPALLLVLAGLAAIGWLAAALRPR